MATFSVNPHPSDDNISGTLCSLLLSDGASDIKLANLTEMIEVQPFFQCRWKVKEAKVRIVLYIHTI